MKTTIIKGILVFLGIAAIYYLVMVESKRFDTTPYKTAIDSLQQEINLVHKQNDSLESTISFEEEKNQALIEKASELKHVISNLKTDNSKLKAAQAYHPHQVDSFFVVRYTDQYKVVTKDTTHLPVPVSKAVVVDLVDFDRTKHIVLNQDSLINNLQNTVQGKDKIIVTLRTKEDNYNSIIQKQIAQQDNYKIMVSGLEKDIKKNDWKLKKAKITNFVLGTIAVGLLVTHK